MLKILLDVLVDSPEKYNEQDREEMLTKANLMTPSILAGTTSRATVSSEWLGAAGAILGAGTILGSLGIGAGIAATSAWLVKAISKPKTNRKD